MSILPSLNETEARLKAVIEHANDGIITINDKGIIDAINPAAARIFGYIPNEVIGRNIKILMPDNYAKEHDGYIENYKNTGEKKIIGIGREVRGKKKDGSEFPFRLSVSEIKLADIRIFTGFIYDLSEINAKESELEESKNKIEAIINTAANGIVSISREGIIEMVNPALAIMFGYSSEELLGEKINLLMPEPFRNEHDQYMNNYHRTKEQKIIGVGREVVALKKSGEIFHCNLSVSEVKLKDRIIYTGIIHDITEQKETKEKLKKLNQELESRVLQRTKELADLVNKLELINNDLANEIKDRKSAEKALRESQKLFAIIAENFPDGTINVLDSKLNYIFVQGKVLRDAGIRSENLIGTNMLSRMPKHVAEKLSPIFNEVFSGIARSIEIENQGQHFTLSAVPLADEKQKVDKILIVEKNVTEDKKVEQEIRNALEKERELNELKSRFVSMASHEFRTPLSTILSSLSLLLRYDTPETADKKEKHITRIRSNVGHLTNILNDFLSLDKLEEGKVNYNPIEFDLKQFCIEIAEQIQTLTKVNQKIKYKHTGLKEVFLDKQVLKNVINNLLSNAIKYSESEKHIYFNTEVTKEKILIEVTDQGIGIPPEDLEHLFERFFRAGNVTAIQGTGLGLNIVKKYVDLMSGTIKCESKQGVGTSFYIEITKDK